MFATVDELEPEQTLLVRIDVNAPLEDGEIQDNRRFARHAESIERLLEDDHALAVLAHQGRPGRDTFVSLRQHAEILGDHLGQSVDFVEGTYDETALDAITQLDAGDVCLLENVRFIDDELEYATPEAHAETEFVQTLAPHFDAYVNDAYSVAHRDHASIVGFPEVMAAYAGPVMETEYDANTAIGRRSFDGPVTMVLGGIKAEDVLSVMEHLDGSVDHFLLGGVLCELFLRAEGYAVGYDVENDELYDDVWTANEDAIESMLEEYGDRIHLPVDLARNGEDGDRVTERIENIEKDDPYLDVGEATIDEYRPVIEESAAVLVKGALGAFEDEDFSYGTRGVLKAIAATDCFSVVGGGDTSRAVDLYDLDPQDFDHLSIAGGAYLHAITGESLPGVEALEEATERMRAEQADA
jgi:phosphoglycerate kinase